MSKNEGKQAVVGGVVVRQDVPARPDVTIRMPHDTAVILLAILGKVGGSGPNRVHVNDLYGALRDIIGAEESDQVEFTTSNGHSLYFKSML